MYSFEYLCEVLTISLLRNIYTRYNTVLLFIPKGVISGLLQWDNRSEKVVSVVAICLVVYGETINVHTGYWFVKAGALQLNLRIGFGNTVSLLTVNHVSLK